MAMTSNSKTRTFETLTELELRMRMIEALASGKVEIRDLKTLAELILVKDITSIAGGKFRVADYLEMTVTTPRR